MRMNHCRGLSGFWNTNSYLFFVHVDSLCLCWQCSSAFLCWQCSSAETLCLSLCSHPVVIGFSGSTVLVSTGACSGPDNWQWCYSGLALTGTSQVNSVPWTAPRSANHWSYRYDCMTHGLIRCAGIASHLSRILVISFGCKHSRS